MNIDHLITAADMLQSDGYQPTARIVREAAEEIERLRSQLHTARGLLDTAIDAMEINSGKSPVWLSVEWYDKARELVKEE